jgi:NagD protein
MMIGDKMETDILGGVQLGFHTLLVLSGGTREEDLEDYTYRPEMVVESFAEFAALLEKLEWRPPWGATFPAVGDTYSRDAVALARL